MAICVVTVLKPCREFACLQMTDHKAFPRGFHDGFGQLAQAVDFQNPFGLREQTIQQSEVTTCDADDGRGRLGVQWMLRKMHAGRPPVLVQQFTNLLRR